MNPELECFFQGHGEEAQGRSEYRAEVYDAIKPYLVAEKDVFCGRCDKRIGFYAKAKPPEDEPHRVQVLKRTSITTYDDIFYASCWCGWLGKEYISWFSAHDEQLEHLNVPYIEDDTEEPDGHQRI